jgi:hypothetical protein
MSPAARDKGNKTAVATRRVGRYVIGVDSSAV